MRNRLVSVLVLLALSVFFNCLQAQIIGKAKVDNGVILKRGFRDKVIGELLEEQAQVKTVLTVEGDTVSVQNNAVKKAYLSDEIVLYGSGRFHFKEAKLWNYSMGFSEEHLNIDLVLSQRFQNGLEIGAGIGPHLNMFSVYTPLEEFYIEVLSFPIYLQAKYMLTNGSVRFYSKGRLGYANNVKTWNMNEMKDGVIGEVGFGFMLPARRRVRHYIELSQYVSHARGEMIAPSLSSDITFSSWFFRTVFTYGVEIGR